MGVIWRRVGPNLWYNRTLSLWLSLGESHPLWEEPGEGAQVSNSLLSER